MRVILLSCLLVAATAATATAQTVRYVGRAVAEFATGNTSSAAHAGGDVEDDSIFCDESVDCCFDQPNGCENPSPTLASRTLGGAGESVDATPGFPRVSSRAGVISVPLPDPIGAIVAVSGVQAIADSDGEALGEGSAGLESSCGVITLTTDEAVQEIIPALDIDLQITDGAIARCTRRVTNRDGLSSVEVTLVILEIQSDQPQILRANALAGVELPFTDGGHSCNVSRSARGFDATPLAVLGVLWLVSRRRTRRT